MWKSRRQRIIATSTAEAETVAMSDATKYLVAITGVLRGLGLADMTEPVNLVTDNKSAFAVVTSNGPHRNKALMLRAAIVRDAAERGILEVQWRAGEEQLADGMTKPLNTRAHKNFRVSMGVLLPSDRK